MGTFASGPIDSGLAMGPKARRRTRRQILIGLGMPLLSGVIQWLLWPWLQPEGWFLFFPAVFFSAMLGGLGSGLISTAAAVPLMWYLFTPAGVGWQPLAPSSLYSTALFVVLGCLISASQERLRRAKQKLKLALAESQAGIRKVSRRSRQTLLETRQRHRFALESFGIGEWEFDPRSGKTTHSVLHDRIFGYPHPLPEWGRRQFSAHVLPEDRDAVDRLLDRALTETGECDFECRIRREDGETRWIQVKGQRPADTGEHSVLAGIVIDITERKRAESALRESESRLKLFIEHAPAALAMFDRGMRYLAASRRWNADYGLTGRDLTDLCHYQVFPEIPERWKEAHRRGLTGEVVKSELDDFRRADGSVQWLRWEVRPWPKASGEIGGIVVFSEDITAQWRQSQELDRYRQHLEELVDERTAALSAAQRETEQALQRFRSIFELTPLGVVISDAGNGRIIEVNQGFATIVGRSRSELSRLDWMQITHPDDLERNLAEIARLNAREIEAVKLNKRYLRPDGTVVWATITLQPFAMEIGDRRCNLSLIEDISEQHRTEAAQQRLLQRLSSILEGTGAGTWEWNVQTGEMEINERWAELLGYSLEELAPVSIATWKRLAHPDDLALSNGLLERHFAGELERYECEVRLRHRQGHWIWVIDHGRLYSRTEDGKPLWMAGTHIDITRLKLAETELLERQQELARSNGELEQFAYMASHDLRQPLRMIHSFIQIIADRLQVPPDDDMRQMMGFVTDGASRLDQMLLSLLEYSRVGRMGAPMAPMDSRAAADEALLFLGRRSVKRARKFTSAPPRGRWSPPAGTN
jgi:PAS domain S-box-containing protein